MAINILGSHTAQLGIKHYSNFVQHRYYSYVIHMDIVNCHTEWISKQRVTSYELRVELSNNELRVKCTETTSYELIDPKQRVTSYELNFETTSYKKNLRVEHRNNELRVTS